MIGDLQDSKQEEYVSLLKRRREIKRTKQARITGNPLEFYWPHVENCDGTQCWTVKNTYTDAYGVVYTIKGCPQYFFHTSLADIRCYFGSNRAGKTAAGIVETGFHLTGLYPDWYPSQRKYDRAVKGRILAEDFKKAVGEVITPAIEKWIPKSLIVDKDKNSQGIYDKYWIKHASGQVSSFDIITYQQGSEVAEGWNGDFCIEGNQRVLKSNGIWTEIKDIKVGDEVWTTHDNYLRVKGKVVNHINMGVKEIVEVKARGGHSIKCTPDHKLWTLNRGWVEAQGLTTKDKLYSPIFNIEGKDTIPERLAFMLGVWIGDGWFNKSIFVALANDVLKKQIEGSVKKITHKSKYDYRIVDKELRQLLIDTELYTKKSGTKFIPGFMFKEGKRNIVRFLEGLYTTDGWFVEDVIGYGTTSKRLAEDLRFLLRNIGIRAGIYFKKRQQAHWSDQWFVMIPQKHNREKFCNMIKVKAKEFKQNICLNNSLKLIGNSVCKDRKARDSRRKVVSVKPSGYAEVYDISIESVGGRKRNANAHSFICNGVKVSNCWYDEPPPRPHYIATSRGLIDNNGWSIFTLTPLKEAWIMDELFSAGELIGTNK